MEIELKSVRYEVSANGLCDTVHGTYEIYIEHKSADYEVNLFGWRTFFIYAILYIGLSSLHLAVDDGQQLCQGHDRAVS